MATAKPAGRIPGEVGIWVFIAGDLIIFAIFFGMIVYLRADEHALATAGQARLSLTAGTLNTILLLTSSLLVVLGLADARRQRPHAATRWLAYAWICGAAFVAVKAYEYTAKVHDGIDPLTNDFWTYYFIFTAIHLLHVLLGLTVLAFLRARTRRGRLQPKDLSLMESGACFWHLVDLLWIVLFALFYVMA
jgi:nitric oxide reductase NorE protein